MKTLKLNGRALAQQLRQEYALMVGYLAKNQIKLKLLVISLGQNPASKAYIKQKDKACQQVGIDFEHWNLDEDTTLVDLTHLISVANSDPEITGILVQLPLPAHLNSQQVSDLISPAKDVDGLTSTNFGKLLSKQTSLSPATAKGVVRLCQHYGINFDQARVLIAGRSRLVGLPLAIMLSQLDATVTLCHSKSTGLEDYLKDTEIFVSATGVRNYINPDYIPSQAILIDVGIHREQGQIIGDLDHSSLDGRIRGLTPVPGGVGPMTVAMLIEQLILAACIQKDWSFDQVRREALGGKDN